MPNLAQYALPSTARSQRLARFMCHTCDLYRPADPAPVTTGDIEGEDFHRVDVVAYTGLVCHYQPTPTFDEPKLEGITKQNSILTSDRWHFLQGQEIGDTWKIVMTTPDHPENGTEWIVQGDPFMNASAPGRPADSQWVYAKVSPIEVS